MNGNSDRPTPTVILSSSMPGLLEKVNSKCYPGRLCQHAAQQNETQFFFRPIASKILRPTMKFMSSVTNSSILQRILGP